MNIHATLTHEIVDFVNTPAHEQDTCPMVGATVRLANGLTGTVTNIDEVFKEDRGAVDIYLLTDIRLTDGTVITTIY